MTLTLSESQGSITNGGERLVVDTALASILGLTLLEEGIEIDFLSQMHEHDT